MSTDARGDGFFTDVRMAGPVDQAFLVRAGQLLLAPPDQDHGTIKRQELIVAEMRRSIGRGGVLLSSCFYQEYRAIPC